ncbi:MAG: ATP-binding protein, partial [Paludibacteraceae bacterium]|nr:ATP-binding protein [Paludibacteraceae bacterium]
LPNDELGDISHTIITLYWKLRHSEEDKARIKRQITQNAAHELKTPAMSIHGYIESILDNPNMPSEKRQCFLERCFAQSERMNRLLMNMAQLTRLDEMPMILSQPAKQVTHVDIVPIIKNVLEDTALQLNEKGIQHEVELPEKLIISSPLSDPEETLYSIFRNLVDNAIFYATGASLIRISFKDGEFSFSDNGIGVSPKHLPYLFERFYRVDKGRSRKMGGTGLGLAIVKNAVAAHGGTITAHTTPGGGLTFKFTFPS